MKIIRPSLMDQIEKCPPVVFAAARSLSSRAAGEGNERHTWLDQYLVERLGGYAAPDPPAHSTWLPGAVQASLEVLGYPDPLIPERRCRLTLAGLEIEGTADAVSPGHIVVDWKTGYAPAVKPLRDSLQIAFYAHATEAWEAAICHLLDDVRVERAPIADLPSRDRLESVVARAIEAEDTPVLGPHCDTCYHKTGCRAQVDNLTEFAADAALPPALIDTPALLSRWLRAKQLGSQLEDGVKAAGAPVALEDGRIYGPGTGKLSVADVDACVRIAAERGIAIVAQPKLSLTLSEIDNAAGRAKEELRAALLGAGAVTRATTWSGR